MRFARAHTRTHRYKDKSQITAAKEATRARAQTDAQIHTAAAEKATVEPLDLLVVRLASAPHASMEKRQDVDVKGAGGCGVGGSGSGDEGLGIGVEGLELRV